MKQNSLFVIVIGIIVASCNWITPTTQIEGLVESTLYSVKVNKQEIWTEQYISNLDIEDMPAWFNASYVHEPQEMHIASFEGGGSFDFVITMP
ncbi:MAG TPA: hypothetical protein GXX64_09180, partial [Bacteroidales bacterium]|nr:hypothetical protein [Bacteroidales bacterium]